MATPLPITVRASPLPSNFRGTPQQLVDSLVARLSLETQEELTLFVSGSVEPTSDQGPWLKNGVEWYVWDSGTGAYVPQTIAALTALNPKPFRGNLTAPQDIVFASPGSDEAELVFTEEFDDDDVFSDSTFTAPDNGIYHITSKMAISATAGTPTDNIILFYPKKNGFSLSKELIFEELGDVGMGRTYLVSTDLALNAGDTIKMAVGVSIGGGTATWTITQNDTWFSGYKIKST